MHSLLITQAVTSATEKWLGSHFRYYRLVFNLFSLVTLVPLYLYGQSLHGEVVISWQGWAEVLRWALLLISFYFFGAGAQAYDIQQFLGLRQISSGTTHLSLSSSDTPDTSGILQATRHPWYAGALLLIWSWWGDFTVARIIVCSILSIYLIIGTLLEEQKLLAEYGEAYRNYQQKVSMLFPLKWLAEKFFRSRN